MLFSPSKQNSIIRKCRSHWSFFNENTVRKLSAKFKTQSNYRFHIAPKTFRPYVDDNHDLRWLLLFLHILNKQDPAIQSTIEHEDQSKSLNFLNNSIMNTINDKNEVKIHRKDAITKFLHIS